MSRGPDVTGFSFSEKCFTASQHAARPLSDRCTECLVARKVTPGPRDVTPVYPSLDPWHYPVACGPSGFLPAEAGPPTEYVPGANPSPELSFARPPLKVLPDYPAPEVTSREGRSGPEKRAVQDLEAYARERGWKAWTTYARGHAPHATHGTPLKVADSLAVRMMRGQERAWAVYRGGSTWSWDTLYVNGCKHESITAFKEAL
jgi:hypothetical protein